MRKSLAMFFSFFMLVVAKAQTVDEILSRFETAIGSSEALDVIKTVQITSTLNFDMMGRTIDASLTTIRKQGKFFRRHISGVMGMDKSYTIITDKEGFTYIPRMRGGGGFGGRVGGGRGGDREMGGGGPPMGDGGGSSGGGLMKLDTTQVIAQQFELDCAGPFAPLVHYAEKGNKVELLGNAKVNKVDCYKVKLTLKTGQETTYYFSTKDSLIVQSETIAKVVLDQVGLGPILTMFGATSRNNLKTTMNYSEYKSFSGIKFPSKQKLSFGALDIKLETTDVKLNEPIDAKWYTAD